MRDAVVLGIILLGALVALRRPWIGALVWTWVSIASPHMSIAWGLASAPVGIISAASTLIGLFFTKERQNPFRGAAIFLLLALVIWTTVTIPFSFHYNASVELWDRSIKIWLMLFVTVALLDTREKLNTFVWVCAVSIGYFSFKGGIFTIATGGGHRVWGPGGFIGGNNEFAVAMLMTIPLIRYLQLQMDEGKKWQRRFMTIWMLASAAAALGSQSRGALIGIIAMTFFLWLKGTRKLSAAILIILTALFLLPFMPDSWWERMSTINSYSEDASATGRFDAWGMAWELAKDRFPFGGGFMVWTRDLFAIYAPLAPQNRAAHSIYFQMLGEHGWGGLLLFLGIGFAAWRMASHVVQTVHGRPDLQWASDLCRMCQVSLIGYAAGGAFLSLAYFDLPYNCVAMIALAQMFVMRASQVQIPAKPLAARAVVPESGHSPIARSTYGAP